jgi:hypothetical protein
VLLEDEMVAGKTVLERVQGRTLFARCCPWTLTTGASLCFRISGIRPGRLVIDDVSELLSHGSLVATVFQAEVSGAT